MRWLAALCPICCQYACTGHDTLPALATESDDAPETVRCSTCEKRATVRVMLKLRPQPLFGKPSWVPSCPSCLESVKAGGAVLDMTAIPQPAS